MAKVNTNCMLIFKNIGESKTLLVASYIGVFACLVPISTLGMGKVSVRDVVGGTCLFGMMTVAAVLLRRYKAIELRVADEYLEVVYPLKEVSKKIPYKDIQEVNFSDLSTGISLRLKSGEKISLGSTIQRHSGAFTVEDIGPADVQGTAGERFRLMKEILAKVKA